MSLYDVFLFVGCDTMPFVGELPLVEFGEARNLADPNVRMRALAPYPGFLGIRRIGNEVYALLQLLEKAGASGLVVPVAYRAPRFTQNDAHPIASEYLRQRQNEPFFARYTFAPPRLHREHPMWWTFEAPSEDFTNDKRWETALRVSVDKLDGHIWQPREFEQYLALLKSGRV